ncbi:MAG TPA: signal peptidase I [Motilibacteraceae bacterium]|nr:signal peptidase I [Motilibacteraceae bacterium]
MTGSTGTGASVQAGAPSGPTVLDGGTASPDASRPAGQSGSSAERGPGRHRAPAGTGRQPARGPLRRGRRRAPRRGSAARELGLVVVVALLLSLLVKTFLVQAFSIPSGSMEPTLHGCPGCTDDRILVDRTSRWRTGIHRGDVVVFHDPGGWLPEGAAPGGLTGAIERALAFVGVLPSPGEHDLVKRVIGVGGDVVEGRDGRVLVDGVPLDEPYVHPGDAPTAVDFRAVVPPGSLWVMGDHRSDSADSRAHQASPGHGFVPLSDVVGRAVAVVWPLSRAGGLHRPATFDQPGLR